MITSTWLEKVFKRPLLIVLITGIITVFFALQLPRAELDNNNLRFMPPDDQALLTSQYIDDNFGSSFFILVAFQRHEGDVFDPPFLHRIREFVEVIEDYEITGNVDSLVSSQYIYSQFDSWGYETLVVEPLSPLDGPPLEADALRQRLLSWDIYQRSLVSDDFRATQILIPLNISNEQASRPEIISSFIEIRDLAKDMFSDQAEVYVTGLPIITAVINEAMTRDLVVMIPLVVLLVLVMLFFSFREAYMVFLPLVSVLLGVIWSMGAMPLFGVKLSVVSTVLPVILVAVGSAYSIHLVTHYRHLRAQVLADAQEEGAATHRAMVLGTLQKIAKPVSLAALTTMAGFISFAFTTVIPIREFGLFATFGVFVSCLLALSLVPALLLLKGGRTQVKGSSPQGDIRWGPADIFTKILNKKAGNFIVLICVLALSAWGASRLVIDNIFIEYFRPNSEIALSDRFIREHFGGSKVLSIMVEAGTSEELLRPEALGALDRFSLYFEEELEEVGKIMGFTDLIKRINQVLNAHEDPEGLSRRTLPDDSMSFFNSGGFGFGFFDDVDDFDDIEEAFPWDLETPLAPEPYPPLEPPDPEEGRAYYEIPTDPERYGVLSSHDLGALISSYLLLLSGNIDSYANDPLEPRAIKTTVQLRTLGNIDTDRVVGLMEDYIEEHFPPDLTVTIGGSALVESSLNRLVVESQVISLLISILVVFFIISISNRSLKSGLLGIAPLSVCILINFGVMGFAGITLNIGTSMMASLCVGIGIDYAIHFMEAYKREYAMGGNFLIRAYASSGRAICINALSVGAGFGVLMLSQFVMLQDLGLLIAITMASSALVSLTVLPLLLSIFKPKFILRETQQ
ncbi:MAG: efflux RND transporter permease subunit [Treponema sp.]|nr:efflux RND transporter permease subunit [Treponema sp.]